MTPTSAIKQTYPVRGSIGMAVVVIALTLGIDQALKPLHAPQLLVEAAWQALLLLAVWFFAASDGVGIRSLNPGRVWNKRDALFLVALLLFSYAGSIAYRLLMRAFLPRENALVNELIRNFKALDPVSFVVVAIGLAVLVGLSEELVFRSYFMTRLRACGLSAWLSILISAAAFGLVHLPDQGFLLAVEHAVFWGIPAGYFFHLRGSILPLILAHFLIDAFGFMVIYLVPFQ